MLAASSSASLCERNLTSAIASRWCFDLPDIPRPNPPNVPTPIFPDGTLVTPIFPYIVDFAGSVRVQLEVQPRENAALPTSSKSLTESTSSYAVTLGGEIQPIQCAARCHARIAFSLLTLMVRLDSMIVPPPSDACHSKATPVRPSSAAPGQINPQKLLAPAA